MLPAKKPEKLQNSAQSTYKDSNTVTSNAPPPYQEHHRRKTSKPSKFVAPKESMPSQSIEQPVKQGAVSVSSKAPPPYSFSQQARAQGLFSCLRSQPSREDFTREFFGSLRPAAVENQSQKAATFAGEALSNASK